MMPKDISMLSSNVMHMKACNLPRCSASELVWREKYQRRDDDGVPLERSLEDTFSRVATALSSIEQRSILWRRRFKEVMTSLEFLPGGRVLAGAGMGRGVTLMNSFVMARAQGEPDHLFGLLRSAVRTMEFGGGIGIDFSSIRPKSSVFESSVDAVNGPLELMEIWNSACDAVNASKARRGAMMAMLSCSHPDIEEFINAKRIPDRFKRFNLSVLISDDFMHALETEGYWELQFNGKCYKRVLAADIWRMLVLAAHESSEPGVLFIDTIKRMNPLRYCEEIAGTNSCAEAPMAENGSCPLGSVNLASLIIEPFTQHARLDVNRLERVVSVAVRLLDNSIDVSDFPTQEQADEAKAKRRIGLGVTGLADALIMCCTRYGSQRSLELVSAWFKALALASYRVSARLASEKRSFRCFDEQALLGSHLAEILDPFTRALIKRHGLRNGMLNAVAPAGSISIIANNISSGIEPIFRLESVRRVGLRNGGYSEITLTSYSLRLFRLMFGNAYILPEYFVSSNDVEPLDQIATAATAQGYVDASISKTVVYRNDHTQQEVDSVLRQAFKLGCKAVSVYRPSVLRGHVIR